MQNTKLKKYEVNLQSETSKSFLGIKASQSLDIDTEKKSKHSLLVNADIETDFNIGLIVGASGSGKTTLAEQIYGKDCFKTLLNLEKSVIDQFPEEYTYEEVSQLLCGVGLASVPCWIRPAYTLSNGQKARAEVALQMANMNDNNLTIIDEWTSVVDRTVAKVMSSCISKNVRKTNKSIVLLSCHYDIIDWVNPDWIIDCNSQKFIDRRYLWPSFKKEEEIEFTVREVNKATWKYFSKYHYLNENLVGGLNKHFGLFCGEEQVGFISYNNYIPIRYDYGETRFTMHFNRLVIHPDYCGFGLGLKFLNATAKIMSKEYIIRGKFSSAPMYHSLKKDNKWVLTGVDKNLRYLKNKKELRNSKYVRAQKVGGKTNAGFRTKIKTYSFGYKG